MNQSLPPMSSTTGSDHSIATATRLSGRWLVIARVVWVVVAVFTMTVFIASLPVVFANLEGLCTASVCLSRQLSPEQARTLQETFGLSLQGYAILSLVLLVITSSVWLACGFLLFWRKSDDWMVLLFALESVTQVMTGPYSPIRELAQSHSPWLGPVDFLNPLGTFLGLLLIALFPNGRFVPRWIGWLVMCSLCGFIVVHVIPTSTLVSFLLGTWLFFGTALILVGAQIYRYWRVSTPVQRQQTKWVVLSLALLMLVVVGAALPSLFFPALLQPGSLYNPALYLLEICLIPLLAVGFGVALLRYRLWDVDALINKALVYGLLTVLLAGVYVGLVLGLQALLGEVLHQTNAIALVISTLALYALFRPVRNRMQQIIDRRFYRRKYDAARTLAAFNATLRQDVDLATLSEHLVEVVQETMQPMHVSLWLREGSRTETRSPQTDKRSSEEAGVPEEIAEQGV